MIIYVMQLDTTIIIIHNAVSNVCAYFYLSMDSFMHCWELVKCTISILIRAPLIIFVLRKCLFRAIGSYFRVVRPEYEQLQADAATTRNILPCF